MRPIKSLSPFAGWLLRLGLVFMVGVLVWPALKQFQFTNLESAITLAFALFAVLVFIGGFMSKHTLTMLSGLVLFLLSVWHLYWNFRGISINFAAYALTGIIGLHFFINGNK